MIAEYQLEDYAKSLLEHSDNVEEAYKKLDEAYAGIKDIYESQTLRELYADDMHWIRREYGQYVTIHGFMTNLVRMQYV